MNAQIYSLLLTLFPVDLRREFGVEMTQVFMDDLEEHRRRSGIRGVVRVWRRSLADLCVTALREVVTRRQFVTPLIANGLVQLVAGLMFLVDWNRPAQWLLSFSWSGLIPAMVAFLAVRALDNSAPILLKLERR